MKQPPPAPSAKAAHRRAKKALREKIYACDRLLAALGKASLHWDKFTARLAAIHPEFGENPSIENCQAAGLDAELMPDGTLFCRQRARGLSEQKFCVVDIEANDSFAGGQILEIGAVLVQNGRIIGEFSQLCHARGVSAAITELTGITDAMLEGAPRPAAVLFALREFLADAIFVAHGAYFDYSKISRASCETLGFPLLNRRLCTLALARKFLPIEGGFSLANLREKLGIQGSAHRALDDARAAAAVLNEVLTRLPHRNFLRAEDLFWL